MKQQVQLNYARANMLSHTFKNCSLDAKCLLFRTYRYSQYCCCGIPRQIMFISGVNGKPVYRISFRFGRNDEIRKEYLSTGN